MKSHNKKAEDRTPPRTGDSPEKKKNKGQFDPGHGQEITRTGRETDKRDVEGFVRAVTEDEGLSDDEQQNSGGGKRNR